MSNKVFVYEKLSDTSKFAKSIDEDGYMHLKGTFGVCGVRNRNNRVYETSNYTSMVKRLQERIQQNGGILGELEHPNTMAISMENASHVITAIDIDEKGVVEGEIKLLHTPKGKIAEEIVRGGIPLFISSRAQGVVDKNGNVTLEDLATYDIVSQPGFAQARLNLTEGLVQESLSDDDMLVVMEKEEIEENKENKEENMENNEEIKNVTFEELNEKIQSLEERLAKVQESMQNSAPEIDLVKLADGIQKWITEEYSPKVEEWAKNELSANIKESIINKMAPAIEKWVTEEYGQHIADSIQKWIVEEYSPNVEKWVVEEYSKGLQNWITEEYSNTIDGWMKDEVKPFIAESIKSNVDANLENTFESKLDVIDDVLSILENNEPAKPAYESKHQQRINESKNMNEGLVDEPLFIREMPANVAPKWNMATPEVKESIKRRAKLYELTNEEQITRFWNNIVFENVKPATNLYEGLENIKDDTERLIRQQLRRHSR